MSQPAADLSLQTIPSAQISQRPGKRLGIVAELSVIAPLKPGGAETLHAKFQDTSGPFRQSREHGRDSPRHALGDLLNANRRQFGISLSAVLFGLNSSFHLRGQSPENHPTTSFSEGRAQN